ncbi:MAG: signal peptidase II [Tannerellaceae bacterium]|nr:signal peptidase II [Tannerellaceae bacterium]
MKFVLTIFVLVWIDLGIKTVIHHNFMETQFDILPPWFYFKPVYNTHYFYLGAIMGWKVPLWIVLLFSLLILFIFDFIYESYSRVCNHVKLTRVAFSMGFAGIICAILSNILWPGCLDYIYLKPLYIFDLKDVYLNICWILVGAIALLEYKQTAHLTLREMWKIYKSRFKSSN